MPEAVPSHSLHPLSSMLLVLTRTNLFVLSVVARLKLRRLRTSDSS